MFIVMFKKCAKYRGINTVLVRSSDRLKVGTPNTNGTYDGLIGLLQNDVRI